MCLPRMHVIIWPIWQIVFFFYSRNSATFMISLLMSFWNTLWLYSNQSLISLRSKRWKKCIIHHFLDLYNNSTPPIRFLYSLTTFGQCTATCLLLFFTISGNLPHMYLCQGNVDICTNVRCIFINIWILSYYWIL